MQNLFCKKNANLKNKQTKGSVIIKKQIFLIQKLLNRIKDPILMLKN